MTRWIARVATVTSLLGAGGSGALAQAPPPATSTGLTAQVPSAAMLANPYMNPYLNPYLNPLATQRPVSGRDAAMYLYMANQANGGIGTGRISGTRPAPGGQGVARANPNGGPQVAGGGAAGQGRFGRTQAQARRPVAELPDSASTPGSGAARFFNPGPVNVNGAGRYYARRNTYFNSNGH